MNFEVFRTRIKSPKFEFFPLFLAGLKTTQKGAFLDLIRRPRPILIAAARLQGAPSRPFATPTSSRPSSTSHETDRSITFLHEGCSA